MWNWEFSRDVTVLLVAHELSDESNVSANSERMIHNGQNVNLMWYPWKFFTLLRVDVTCTFWKGQIVSDWVSTWEFFGSLCFLHLDLSYMEFLERATMVNRTSSGSRSMKVLQTPKASYSQAHKTMSNHKEKYGAEFYFPFILSNITSRNVSSEVFPCTMGKAFRPSRSAGGNSSKTVKCTLNKSSSGGKNETKHLGKVWLTQFI